MSRVADPGLQPERTELAWRRTGAVTAVNAVLILRVGFGESNVFALAVGLGVSAFAVMLLMLGLRRRGELAQPDAGAPAPVTMRLAAMGVSACALATAWLMLRG